MSKLNFTLNIYQTGLLSIPPTITKHELIYSGLSEGPKKPQTISPFTPQASSNTCN